MDTATWIAAITTAFAIVTAVVAALALRKQSEVVRDQAEQLKVDKGLLHVAESANQVDRVLHLHAEFSSADVAEARNRFSELMWRAGEAAFGTHICWCPDWNEIYPPSPGCDDKEANGLRVLGEYPTDMGATGHRPVYDLRMVLRCLGRIDVARRDEKAALKEDLAIALLGWDVVWWNLVCKRLDTNRDAILQPIHDLSSWVEGHDKTAWMKGSTHNPSDGFLAPESYDERVTILRDRAKKPGL